jgi:hypothetical protein
MGEIISQDVSGRLKRSLGHYTDLTSLTSQLADSTKQLKRLEGTICPKELGAVGDGIADDTTYLLQAASQAKIIDLRNGIYKFSSTITLDATQYIKGNGLVNAELRYTGSGSAIIQKVSQSSGSVTWGEKHDGFSLYYYGTNQASGTVGIEINHIEGAKLGNVRIGKSGNAFETGVKLRNTNSNSWTECFTANDRLLLDYNFYGVVFEPFSSAGGSGGSFMFPVFEALAINVPNNGIGVWIKQGATVRGCQFKGVIWPNGSGAIMLQNDGTMEAGTWFVPAELVSGAVPRINNTGRIDSVLAVQMRSNFVITNTGVMDFETNTKYNLVRDSSFEASEWKILNAVGSFDSVVYDSNNGKQSLKINNTGSYSGLVAQSQRFPVSGNKYYTMLAKIRLDNVTVGEFRVAIYWKKADGSPASTDNSPLLLVNTVYTDASQKFKEYSNGVLAPSDASYAYVGITTYASGGNPQSSGWVDNVSVTRGMTNLTYFPNPLELYDFSGNIQKVGRFVTVPTTATSNGMPGDFSSDGSYLYICHAVNTWKRVAVATW